VRHSPGDWRARDVKFHFTGFASVARPSGCGVENRLDALRQSASSEVIEVTRSCEEIACYHRLKPGHKKTKMAQCGFAANDLLKT